MAEKFNAIVADDHDGKTRAGLAEISLDDLPDDDVLVDVAWSTLNYKDALAVSGKGKICRFLPMVCGIDLAGEVIESANSSFQSGDRVLVNGFGLAETHWGGYSQKQRVKAEWLVRIPDAFSLQQAMAIGTAGYTAMLCVQALLDYGIETDQGPLLVTGACGGVGSVATMLLSRLGFQVTAATGRAEENTPFLRTLGAQEVLNRDELSRPSKPLESEKWNGVVDVVGGETLATVLAQTCYGGAVAATGLAGGFQLNTTVAPFILRGVSLLGVDSVMADLNRRQQAWNRLADLVDLDLLGEIYTVEPMSDVPRLAEQLLGGQVRGRIVIDVNA